MGYPKITENRTCFNCSSNTTYTNHRGWVQWHKINGDWYCHKCRGKLFSGPKYNPINCKRNNTRKIFFKGKFVYLKKNPKKGICSWCKKKIGDSYINAKGQIAKMKRTAMHHIEYHEADVLEDTIEICASCHGKESARLRKI